MMQYNFNSKIAPFVESGIVRQTVRKLGKRRPPRCGESLQLYAAMGSKKCRKLIDATCLLVRSVTVNCGVIWLAGRALNAGEALSLARANGFEGVEDLLQSFRVGRDSSFEGYTFEWGRQLSIFDVSPVETVEPSSDSPRPQGDQRLHQLREQALAEIRRLE